jgi:hypothetical protein
MDSNRNIISSKDPEDLIKEWTPKEEPKPQSPPPVSKPPIRRTPPIDPRIVKPSEVLQ